MGETKIEREKEKEEEEEEKAKEKRKEGGKERQAFPFLFDYNHFFSLLKFGLHVMVSFKQRGLKN